MKKRHHRPTGVALLLIGLIIMLCTWLVVAVIMRNRESFADTTFNATELKSFKSDAYNNAGVKYFYSDGKIDQNHIFFNPSMNDIVCKLGSKELSDSGCEPNKNAIDAVSCADEHIAVYPRAVCARKYMTSPSDYHDCDVRIMDGMYRFSKVCVTLIIEVPRNQRNPNEFFVRYGDYTTILMMLLRPIFLRGAHCRLVQPDNRGDPIQSKSVLDMRRNDGEKRLFRTRLVTEPVLIASDDSTLDIPSVGTYVERIFKNKRRPGMIEQSSQNLMSFSYTVKVNESSVSNKNDNMDEPMWVPIPVTLYYMSFIEPVDLTVRNANEPVPVFVVTLYIPTTDAPTRLFRMNNPPLSLAWENRNGAMQRLVINTSRGVQTIYAPPGGYVVLTYSTTVLIAAYLSADRYQLVELGKMANLASSDKSILTRAASMHPPPVVAYPYTNGCVPNLADLAIKLGYLNV